MSGRSSARRAARRALGLVALATSLSTLVLVSARGAASAGGAITAGSTAALAGAPRDVTSASPATSAPQDTRRHTLIGEGNASIDVYPPTSPSSARAGAIVVLHGMCMEPSDVCDFWPGDARGDSWALCPRGNGTCSGAPDWVGPIASRVDSARRSLDAAALAHGDAIDVERRVLVGYSRGAFLARDVLYDGHERFSAAIFLGAAVTPEPARLAASGVRRVVMAAGDFDGAKPVMVRAVDKLRAGGIEARFVSLGRMGHGLPANLAVVLAEPLSWARGAETVSP